MGMRFDAVVRSNVTALRAYPADAALTRVTTGTMRLLAVIVLAIGLSFSPIAKTISTYRTRIMRKLGARSDVELTHLSLRHGLISPLEGRAS